jgi:uncharacterized protein (TIGR03435 family)
MAMPGSYLPQRVKNIIDGVRAPRLSRTRFACAALACAIPAVVFAAGTLDHAAQPVPLRPIPAWYISPSSAPDAPAPPVLLAQSRPVIPLASAPAPRPEFEVASVRPTEERCISARVNMDGSRFNIACASLEDLMEYAFRIPQGRVTGPNWLAYHGGPKFDIAAKLPENALEGQVPEMLQTLLAQRFKLAYHRGSQEQAVDALVVAKGGLKVEPAPSDAPAPDAEANAPPGATRNINGVPTRLTTLPDGTRTQTNPRIGVFRETTVPRASTRWEISNATFQGLADLLADALNRPVVDMTGLKGRYQVVLNVSLAAIPAPSADVNASPKDILTDFLNVQRDNYNSALQKVGLQLEMRKAPLETIVVDRVETTPTQN